MATEFVGLTLGDALSLAAQRGTRIHSFRQPKE
jgi:hypothetical protein